MKKQRRKPTTTAKRAAQPAQEQPQSLGRRRAMTWLRNGAVALPILGVGGVFSVRAVQAKMAEGDLTRIGRGTPTIVQIHDPQCQLCQTLQRQTRGALGAYDEDSYTFLVANIKSEAGLALASRYAVPHVTLLMFDPKGEMVEVLRGPAETGAVEDAVARHIGRYGAS